MNDSGFFPKVFQLRTVRLQIELVCFPATPGLEFIELDFPRCLQLLWIGMPRTSGGSILPSRHGSAWIAKQGKHSLTVSIVSNDTLAAELEANGGPLE
jgi:hypothetical protein